MQLANEDTTGWRRSQEPARYSSPTGRSMTIVHHGVETSRSEVQFANWTQHDNKYTTGWRQAAHRSQDDLRAPQGRSRQF
eukprot:4354206-Amphidinium_carterae.1